jgi:hypothetical protein
MSLFHVFIDQHIDLSLTVASSQLLAVSSTIQVMDPRSAQLLHQQQSPSPVASPTDAALASAPAVLVSDDAGGLDPVARAPWSSDTTA